METQRVDAAIWSASAWLSCHRGSEMEQTKWQARMGLGPETEGELRQGEAAWRLP